MKLIELHILQSFPVSCLNRDDVGAPKTAIFGGATRARISSQCLKRAIRERLKDPENGQAHTRFGGIRSRLLVNVLEDELMKRHNLKVEIAGKLARVIAGAINEGEGKPIPDNKQETEALIFFSPAAVEKLAAAAAAAAAEGSGGKVTKKQVVESIKRAGFYDAADIAIFGRMVAAEPSLTVEGAGMFSHALSTHQADPDIDFFSAVDERKEVSAGMIGDLEYTSACYYRYAGLNLDLLFYQRAENGRPAATLSCFAGEDHKKSRGEILDAFIRATVTAVPSARKNSMNSDTLPGYVLGLVKDKGQPVQLINAFEEPVNSKNGLMEKSVQKLKAHHEELKKTWGIQPALEVAIPDKSLNEFCTEILKHV